MNISSRCEYGCRAMLGLAKQYATQEPVASITLAEEWHIPKKYLVHILLQLKRAGLVRSLRGAQGGYILAMPPENISLLNIIEAIDGPLLDPLPVEDSQAEVLKNTWENIAKEFNKILEATTLRQLMDRSSSNNMYYI